MNSSRRRKLKQKGGAAADAVLAAPAVVAADPTVGALKKKAPVVVPVAAAAPAAVVVAAPAVVTTPAQGTEATAAPAVAQGTAAAPVAAQGTTPVAPEQAAQGTAPAVAQGTAAPVAAQGTAPVPEQAAPVAAQGTAPVPEQAAPVDAATTEQAAAVTPAPALVDAATMEAPAVTPAPALVDAATTEAPAVTPAPALVDSETTEEAAAVTPAPAPADPATTEAAPETKGTEEEKEEEKKEDNDNVENAPITEEAMFETIEVIEKRLGTLEEQLREPKKLIDKLTDKAIPKDPAEIMVINEDDKAIWRATKAFEKIKDDYRKLHPFDYVPDLAQTTNEVEGKFNLSAVRPIWIFEFEPGSTDVENFGTFKFTLNGGLTMFPIRSLHAHVTTKNRSELDPKGNFIVFELRDEEDKPKSIVCFNVNDCTISYTETKPSPFNHIGYYIRFVGDLLYDGHREVDSDPVKELSSEELWEKHSNLLIAFYSTCHHEMEELKQERKKAGEIEERVKTTGTSLTRTQEKAELARKLSERATVIGRNTIARSKGEKEEVVPYSELEEKSLFTYLYEFFVGKPTELTEEEKAKEKKEHDEFVEKWVPMEFRGTADKESNTNQDAAKITKAVEKAEEEAKQEKLEQIKNGSETKKWDELIAALQLNMDNMTDAMAYLKLKKKYDVPLGTGLFSKANEMEGGYKKKRTNKRRSIKKIKRKTIRGRKRRTRRK